ncbi:MAG: hypothetical protein PSV16_14065 [Flavobacterium sp.]|nr:hypothetical protein [Flavobacterium sp.]
MKSKIIICLLFLSSISFVSCSSDDSSNSSTSQFEDKWWYSPDNSTLDLKFNADGTYLSVFVFSGQTLNSNGQWEWVDEAAKTFHVFNLQGNATNEFYGKATTLTAHNLGVKMSLDGGATYSAEVPYVDTNN